VLVAFAIAAVASAHWTHDDELAREIGPPPGEEDIDVASLSDELLGESAKAKSITMKTYRVTVGTRANKGSTSKFKFSLTGCETSDAGSCTSAPVGNGHLRYYQGPFMTYALAQDLAPEFRPGMMPVVDKNRLCSGLDAATKMLLVCSKDQTATMFPCEPNGKDCKSAITGGYVGYAQGPVTKLYGAVDQGAQIETGPIQRTQIEMQDVGQITGVYMEEDVVFSSSNPCYTNGASKRQCSSTWGPSFVKVSTNDPKTGIGNGVFYVEPRSDLLVGTRGITGANNAIVDATDKLEAGPPDSSGGIPTDGTQNAILKKCIAQQCEEEMDTKLRLMEMKTEFGESYEAELA
jgi:hypothetical protein